MEWIDAVPRILPMIQPVKLEQLILVSLKNEFHFL